MYPPVVISPHICIGLKMVNRKPICQPKTLIRICSKIFNYKKYFTVCYNILSIYRTFEHLQKAHHGSYLYVSYSSCTHLKAYVFMFNKSNTPDFLQRPATFKPGLQFFWCSRFCSNFQRISYTEALIFGIYLKNILY